MIASANFCNFYPRSPCGERPCLLISALWMAHFYPRSPCGERRVTVLGIQHRVGISIHALLAESDMGSVRGASLLRNFYPRSPCGERRGSGVGSWPRVIFLSTLSLRRATLGNVVVGLRTSNFYPRSPCGERRQRHWLDNTRRQISIHALLAESDPL